VERVDIRKKQTIRCKGNRSMTEKFNQRSKKHYAKTSLKENYRKTNTDHWNLQQSEQQTKHEYSTQRGDNKNEV